MNRDTVAVALAVAVWVSGPVLVLEATTGVGPGSWPSTTVAAAALGAVVALLGPLAANVDHDRLWQFRPVRACLLVLTTGAAAAIVASDLSGGPTTAGGIGGDVIATLGLALVGGGGVGTWLALGRANRRRIAAETGTVAALGRSNRVPSRWLTALFVLIGVVHFGLAGAGLLDGSHTLDATVSFAQGAVFAITGLAMRRRTWYVTECGLLAWHVEYPWAAFESVRVRRDAVHVQFASRVDGWLAVGVGGHCRFDRENVDEAALELLESRDEQGPEAGRARGMET